MISGITNFPGNKLHPTENPFIVVLQENLSEPKSEPLFLAEMMTVPNEQYILEVMGSLDPEVCHEVRNGVRQKIGSQLRENLYIIYDRFSKNTGNDFSRKSVGERALKNLALNYLLENDETEFFDLALNQLKNSKNMTDAMAALSGLMNFCL